MLSKKSSTVPFLVAISLLLLITILLCTPGAKFPKIGWQDKIWFDKWVHIGLFMALVVAWCWFFYSGKKEQSINSKKIFITIAVVSLLYGIVMEIIQEQFIPNRSFEISDILSDGIGALIGYFIAVRKYIKK
jgi:VanZ family protein